jgi:hypothetical protein
MIPDTSDDEAVWRHHLSLYPRRPDGCRSRRTLCGASERHCTDRIGRTAWGPT